MAPDDEKYYIDRVKAGDKQSFAWIVDNYKDLVFTICIRMLSNEEDAREAGQEIFLKIYRSIRTFQNKSKFSTWVYRISYNHCISVIRKKVRVIDLVDEVTTDEVNDSDLDGLEILSAQDRSRHLKLALEALPETDAVVITLYYLKELNLEEIAEITGLSSGNIRIKLHRSRKRLYEVIRNQLNSEIHSLL